jgi:hypothetical protein
MSDEEGDVPNPDQAVAEETELRDDEHDSEATAEQIESLRIKV